ncbi:nicotinamidase-related amidase [Rhizobium taibaishanense]|uniref:Nicotinamidase-related amidase n=2 Tax=Allorhizobium taibaishanense TaxID=887144 RepID=A0A7W6MUU1_9HYPH|nr:nicotinamidase-related amidase [Allorhizobium taibaishanense]
MRPNFDCNWRHICVDMQRVFSEDTPWHVAWLQKVLPQVSDVAAHHAERTIFTRFVPPQDANLMRGAWRHYYEKWWMMTGRHLPGEMVDLVPELAQFVPPAMVFDKSVYSPWTSGALQQHLATQSVSHLVISGGETDVCVLSTVLTAVDLGYYVTVLTDAVCSCADTTHDSALALFGERFSAHVELKTTERFLQQGFA